MKKQIFITTALIFGLSYELFAGTGGAYDGLGFLLAIFIILLAVFGLISGIDYLKKNGKTLIKTSIVSLKKMIISLKDYLNRIKFDYSLIQS